MSNHFFIIGAQRSATTYLYHMLAEHPEIEMAQPLRPEPKFFLQDDLYAQGLSYYESCFFPGKTGAWLRGEKSTSYIEYAHVAERLAANYPDSKILVLMRDPIDRAVSNYLFSRHHGLEKRPFEEALLADPAERLNEAPATISVNPFAYLPRGRYIDYLEVYDLFFPREQIYGIIMEQLLDNLDQVQTLYSYLGVSPDFVPTGLHEQINANDKPQIKMVSAWLHSTLVNYYSEANTRLNYRFGYDLAHWWPSCQ